MRWIAVVLLVGALAPSAVSAQGLGAVAKQEEERRKTVKPSGKVYTNDTIKADPSAPSTPAPATSSASSPTASAPSTPAQDDSKKGDEKYWRQRVKDERDALQKAQSFADALQSQINGLWAEFTACAAPPQCTQLANRRQRAIEDLNNAKKDVEAHTKAVAGIQDEARKAGVPAGWVR